jgi:hypothetical protein
LGERIVYGAIRQKELRSLSHRVEGILQKNRPGEVREK